MTDRPSKKIILAQIFLIFILPVFLIYFKILPSFGWKMALILSSSLMVYGILKKEKWSFTDMGIRSDNFKKALPFYLVFTILGILVLFFINSLSSLTPITEKNLLIRTWIFFLPISFFQEFAFRSFLIPRLKELYTNKYRVIFLNSILFTFIHIIYANLKVVLPLTFLSGILFAWLYYKYPNLVLISISHSILNLTAVLLGFFL
jgi:membrane protease YdiL (CAAX protease family)